MNNIILIGFMGVGKGTVARELSRSLGVVCLDTDDLIESIENTKIKKIFKVQGESHFRELEKNIANWLEKDVQNTIISTGGGFYKVENLKKIGKVIYLSSPYDEIVKRIEEHPNAKNKIAKRPLMKDKKKAKELHGLRVKEYEKVADITIDVTKKSLDKIIDEIRARI